MERIDEALYYEDRLAAKDREIASLKEQLARRSFTIDDIANVIVNWNGFAEYELAAAIFELTKGETQCAKEKKVTLSPTIVTGE